MERAPGAAGSGAPGRVDGPAVGGPVPDGGEDQPAQADGERAPRRQ